MACFLRGLPSHTSIPRPCWAHSDGDAVEHRRHDMLDEAHGDAAMTDAAMHEPGFTNRDRGGGISPAPSHTTVRTGPYTAVQEVDGSCGQLGQLERGEQFGWHCGADEGRKP